MASLVFLATVGWSVACWSANAETPALDLLARHCVTCHNTSDPKGGLDLSQAATALRGADSGPVIVAAQPEKSILLERVADGSMPPEHDGRRLTKEEVAVLRDWVTAGANWPANKTLSQFEFTTERRAGYDWWSLQPLVRPPTPLPSAAANNAIDAFVLPRLTEAGLAYSPPADRVRWIRRVTIDLLGLPPSPAEVAAFAADQAPDAAEQLVDRLLASPHYGERWGRHWLDVARYGESDGFEHDKYRAHAWPYRDYIIRSLNADKPYAQFVREQLAGDALEQVTHDSIAATGFLVAGPWDEIQNVGASPTEKLRAREEQQEELVATVAQTFLGLTVNCARCHDHKFDPITQIDYYRLKAVFDGVDHGNRPWLTPQEQTALEQQRRPLEASLQRAKAGLAELAAKVPANAIVVSESPPALVAGRFSQTFSPAEARVSVPHSPAFGQLPITVECWARLDSNRAFNILAACNPKSSADHWELYSYAGSGEFSLYLPGYQPAEIKSGVNIVDAKWHYLAATIDAHRVELWVDGKLAKSIAVARNDPKPGASGPLQFGAIAEQKLGCAGLVDEVRVSRGIRTIEHVPEEPFEADERTLGLWHFDEIQQGLLLDASAAVKQANRGELARQRTELVGQVASLEKELSGLQQPQVYAGSRREPAPTLLWVRGDISQPGPAISPGPLSALQRIDSSWKPNANEPEAQRRLRFAAWLTHEQNPLPWRVLANRVWQHHFGRGLLDTPSDFGFNGGQPTHPELLDWLAMELRQSGSLKRLHRWITSSSAYQQSSSPTPELADKASSRDVDNRRLWRFPVRRLEAETIRDAMLAVSGDLNRTQYGPSFKPFTVQVFNTHFYHLHDRPEAEYQRRSIYRAAVVTGRDPLLSALDCPAPSLATPQRQETVTPLQSLGLMNDTFVQRQARTLAARIEEQEPNASARQVRQLYLAALQREPTSLEAQEGVALIQDHGLRELAWALLNCNEFLFSQ
jgi:mono/diheme cytochrome c family protein